MIGIMDEWDQYGNGRILGYLNSPMDREVPILSAIQKNLNDRNLVEVPDEDMIPDIERCIVELDKLSYQRKERDKKAVDPVAKLEKRATDEFGMFMRHAGEKSVEAMSDLLARWNDLHRDPAIRQAIDAGRITNLLAVSIEIESERFRAVAASKAAVA
jgi:hypothetical protein